MTPRPIQLTNPAFLILRKAVANLGVDTGLPLDAASLVSAAELVEAEYATASDAAGGIELRATPAGVRYLAMIDAIVTRVSG